MNWSTKVLLFHVAAPERFMCDLGRHGLAADTGTGGGRRVGWAGMIKGGKDSLLGPQSLEEDLRNDAFDANI